MADDADAGAVLGDDPSTADPGGAGSEGSSDADLSLEDVVSDFEARELGAAEAASSKDDVPGKGAGADALGLVKVFADKNYKGDVGAMLEGIFETRATAKRLNEENKELRQRSDSASGDKAPPRDRGADLKQALTEDPDVQAINQEITSIDKRIETSSGQMAQFARNAASVSAKINELQGQLSEAEPEKKALIRGDLAEMRSRLELIGTQFAGAEDKIEMLSSLKIRLASDLRKAEREIKRSMEDEEQESRRSKTTGERTNQVFDTSFDYYSKAYNVDPESKKGAFVYRTVKLMLADHLATLEERGEEGLDAMGIAEATGRLFADYAATHGLQVRASGEPARTQPRRVTPRQPLVQRTAGSSTAAATRTAPVSASKREELESDPDYWRRRADHIDTARDRASSRRGA